MLKDSDPDMREMAEEEVAEPGSACSTLRSRACRRMLLPRDPNDGRNVFLEIRAGTGGDEAAIFAGDLFRMYSRYAERQRLAGRDPLAKATASTAATRKSSPASKATRMFTPS